MLKNLSLDSTVLHIDQTKFDIAVILINSVNPDINNNMQQYA